MTRAPDPRRTLGARGEQLAVLHLQARGLTVLERNFRTRHGELDVVAADERFLVFCEVKTRVVAGRSPGPLGPLASIGPGKQRRVRAMAAAWLASGRRHGPHPEQIRFDAVGVSVDRGGKLLALEHLEGAF